VRKLIAIWGILGVVLLVGRALWRLTPIALEPIEAGLMTQWHWIGMAAWVVFNAYAEGYRGFHKRYSPRTVARAFYLMDNPTPLRVALAPIFCMGLFGATKKVLITSWVILIMVVALITWMRTLEQPLRGIIDAGVVVGLAWGLASILLLFAQALIRGHFDSDPCVPENQSQPESA
jgi:hypothetical protein